MKSQAEEIARFIRAHQREIRQAEQRKKSLAIPGFPFDAWLLQKSPLYRHSRKEFFKIGGGLEPKVISSPRSLSSDSLLANVIEYSPISEELYWSALDPVERKSPKSSLPRILELRTWCAPVFHEQSHRLLWRFLPPPPKNQRGIHRYLNFCEALVVATDMALGDSLGEKISRPLYLAGATYDPGTKTRAQLANQRGYLNYLHAATTATYLNLELYEESDIRKVVAHLHPLPSRWIDRVVDRCLRLDRGFVEITNVVWQERNWKKLRRLSGEHPLEIPADPLDSRLLYLWAEKWFNWIKV